jgi:hypothetical protein
MPIPVAATSSPGTTIHTAIAGTSAFDEIYLWVSNVTVTAATLTIQFGGTTDVTNDICWELNIPPNSPPIPVCTGLVLQNGLLVKAWSQTASALNLTGYVNRIA